MAIRIETFILGPLGTNCYLLHNERACWVVDPSLGEEPLVEAIRAGGWTVERILLTHGHGDHIAGAGPLKELWPEAILTCPRRDAEMLGDPSANMSEAFGLPLTCPPPDEMIHPGDVLTLGDSAWAVLDTSGHTPGGVSYYCSELGVALTGDALFAGSIGRTDFPGASAGTLLRNIFRSLVPLPGETVVLSGHGPQSTIGEEVESNMFLTEWRRLHG